VLRQQSRRSSRATPAAGPRATTKERAASAGPGQHERHPAVITGDALQPVQRLVGQALVVADLGPREGSSAHRARMRAGWRGCAGRAPGGRLPRQGCGRRPAGGAGELTPHCLDKTLSRASPARSARSAARASAWSDTSVVMPIGLAGRRRPGRRCSVPAPCAVSTSSARHLQPGHRHRPDRSVAVRKIKLPGEGQVTHRIVTPPSCTTWPRRSGRTTRPWSIWPPSSGSGGATARACGCATSTSWVGASRSRAGGLGGSRAGW